MSGNAEGARSAAPGEFAEQRRAMVERQLRGRGIKDSRVLEAMQAVPRHLFVPPATAAAAYSDEPLAIGEGQTISQPYIVAAMTEALELTGTERVLEVGAGSGYQAAILSVLAREVIAIEARPMLARTARDRLSGLGYSNVRIEIGDGTLGWPSSAPYDGILVAAAAPMVPPPLIEQLAEGGRLVIPLGSAEHQELFRVRKQAGRIVQQALFSCRFVPLVGRYAWPDVSLS
ncbi:MAG: protein-L-isoaspartate(D-aspartate) O-methyltransferase [Candidatus Acidiferrales bacterium]